MRQREAILERLESSDEGTFGRLTIDGKSFCTGELPWRDNAVGKSCIEQGSYLVRWTFSPKFNRKTYELLNVPGRTSIRIHPANFLGDEAEGLMSDVDGCIALGEHVGKLGMQKALLFSWKATHEFEEMMGKESFTIRIRGVVPKRKIT